MIEYGINALNHGSSIAVFENHRLIAYDINGDDSKIWTEFQKPDIVYWYERPWLKKLRQLYAKQYSRAFDLNELPSRYIKNQFGRIPVVYTAHHASHAAAGYYTSPFNHCAIVVIDAIGEFECATIWEAKHGEINKIWSRKYPHSLGLFYSAFAQLCGYQPIKEEGEFQKLSLLGNPEKYYYDIKEYMGTLIDSRKNMHKGITDWPYPITEQEKPHIAAAVQDVFTEQIDMVMRKAKEETGSDCLVYMGGCAMNNQANKEVVEDKFKYTWSLPQPGDPSSALGTVLYHRRYRVTYDFGKVNHIDIRV